MSNLNEIAESVQTIDFKTMISSLKSRFFTVAEFPFIQRDVSTLDVLTQTMAVPASEIKNYAVGLKGKELEGLLLDLRDTTDWEEIQRVTQILQVRLSPRLLKLTTILFHYYDSSPGLNEILKQIAVRMKQTNDSYPEGAFARRFGDVEDKNAELSMSIEEQDQDIDQCFQTYKITGDSPFAIKGILTYLSTASKEVLLLNQPWIHKTIESHNADVLYKLIANYLSAFSLIEYQGAINLAILHKIGQPYTSPDWEPYDKELKDRFAQWSYLHQLKVYSVGYPRKFTILSKYYDQVRNSYKVKGENLFVIDFGEIVVADTCDKPYSFFYQKEFFEQEMKAWQNSAEDEIILPTFLRVDKKNLTARDFIIEEVEEPCVKLSYEGVDILYIQEMLDIKMYLEPDMRKKQLAKKMRKKKVM